MPAALSSLLIKPVGAACNLSCGYCFYRPAAAYLPPAPGAMSRGLLEKIIAELLAGRPELAAFGWQGGEPTLAGLDFFKAVIEIQSRRGAPGQRVGNALQTNGLLLDDEWAAFLAEWCFLVGLSLDGPQPVHEAFRRGSWKRSMAAAEALRKRGVAFNVLAVLTEETAARGAKLYEWFVAEGFTDIQFIPCVEPAGGAGGGLAEFSVRPSTLGRFFTETFELWRASGYPRGVSERTFDALLAAAAGQDPGLCTFAPDCASYLVIERAGDAYPCDFFVRPEWRLGSAAESGLAELADSPVRRRFAGLKQLARAACGECPWWGLCHGGCPKDRAAAGTGFDRPSPLCAAYRKLFEASWTWFQAEGQRLASLRTAGRVSDPAPNRPRPT